MGSATVMVAYDGSPGARAALDATPELLRGERLAVVCAWVPVTATGKWDPLGSIIDALSPSSAELDDIAQNIARERAQEGAARAVELGLEADPFVVRARSGVARALADAAAERGVRVLAVGKAAEGRVEEALLGSVPRRLLHIAPCPVLVVPATA